MAVLLRSQARVLLLGLAVLAPMGFGSPAQAVTCDEVRAMTPAEVEYWAKRLQVSSQRLDALLKTAFCDARRAQTVASSNPKPNTDRVR